MTDIELIIKIPEEEYTGIKNAINSLIENGVERTSMSKICLAILDGVQLPSGHGDLIDRRDLIENGINKGFCNWYDEIKMANAIIEADRSEWE
jgi:hypothetical protein